MKNQLILSKELKEEVELAVELAKEAAKQVRAIKRDTSWLQFAKKTKHGYRFLNNKQKQWKKLEEIAQVVYRRFPTLRFGKIIDTLSHLVNTTVEDMMRTHGHNVKRELDASEKEHKKQKLIDIVTHKCHVFRHPWLMPISSTDSSTWLTKNIVTGQVHKVFRRDSEGFCIYELVQI